MKKIKWGIALLLSVGLFFSCGGVGNQNIEEPNNVTPEKENESNIDPGKENGPSSNTESVISLKKSGKTIKFNTGSFNALAIAEGDDSNRSAARSADGARYSDSSDSKLVKILENNTVEEFITLPNGATLQPVSFIAKSPRDDSSDIYIVFQGTSYWWTDEGEGRLGQFVCVKEDGSYYDILETEDNSYKWLYSPSDKDDPIVFDKNGDVYYLVQESSGSNYTNMIYKFNSETGKSTPLTPPRPNTYYEKMQVSLDGQWLFTNANSWNGSNSSRFLSAIPTATPEYRIDLFADTTGSSWVNDWAYADDTKTFFYIKDSTIYSIEQKDGTFNKADRKELFTGDSNNGGDSLEWFCSDSLFAWENHNIITWRGAVTQDNIMDKESYDGYFYFRNPDSEENELQPQEILDYFYAKAYNSLYCIQHQEYDEDLGQYYYVTDSGTSWEEWKEDYKNHKYEMRFDKFADIPGYEALATLTKGKADLDLINAIIDNNLEEMLYNLLNNDSSPNSNPDGWYAGHQYFDNFYEHNFFADVLYEKETGEPISEDLFKKTTYGNTSKFESMGLDRWSMFTSDWTSGYTWKTDYIENDKLVPEKVLQALAKYCGKDEIDFSLEVFKDNENYSILYTDLKNEDAVKFLDNSLRISKLMEYINNLWDGNDGYRAFLAQTCFVKDSEFETPAYVLRSNIIENNSIWWGGVRDLTPSYGKSLYGVYNSNGLIKILDEDGNPVGEYVSALNDYRIVNIVPSDNGFYFQSALLDEMQEESGKHQIIFYDAKDSICDNLFKSVANNKELEVLSYSVGANTLYYSAIRGMSVLNGVIDLETKDARTVSVSTKLSQIITVK